LYGQLADMAGVLAIADAHGLVVVEDAAQAHAAERNGQQVGTFGHAACFSFYPGKNLGAYGDAGAIVTNREDVATTCRMIANHGRVKKYAHDFEGVNSRLDGIQAAILSVKLQHLEAWTTQRQAVASTYAQLLRNSGVILPGPADQTRHVYHLYVVRVPERDRVQAALRERGIATGIHYPIALPNLTAYRYLGYQPEDFPVATRYSHEILSLPMYPELRDDQLEYVGHHLLEILASQGGSSW
jgi:dTDP-4-amino-4,6-dideoxygalactose transaminase